MRQDLASNLRRVGATPTVAALRMRIAETQIKQHRIAAKLDISDGQLSHVLNGRKTADPAFLARIADAIEAVAAEAVA